MFGQTLIGLGKQALAWLRNKRNYYLLGQMGAMASAATVPPAIVGNTPAAIGSVIATETSLLGAGGGL